MIIRFLLFQRIRYYLRVNDSTKSKANGTFRIQLLDQALLLNKRVADLNNNSKSTTTLKKYFKKAENTLGAGEPDKDTRIPSSPSRPRGQLLHVNPRARARQTYT